jgi:ribosomal 50S subunit-recycling heat shock protein
MRIDKFLKVARILKRRTLSKEACESSKVCVNGKDVKPSYNVKIGDVVEIKFAKNSLIFEVLDIKETVKKDQVQSLYRIIN